MRKQTVSRATGVPIHSTNGHTETPRQQVDQFIARFAPEIAVLTRAVVKKLRARMPGAYQLVYDNYNALAIGFSPTEKTKDAIFSIAVWPRWVSLFFLKGADLPDPHRLLVGGGKVARHIVLEGADDLDRAEVQELIVAALERAPTCLRNGPRGRIIIKSISKRQRPRRPTAS